MPFNRWRGLVLGLLLAPGCWAHAGSVELHWEYDLAWQRDTTYRLRIVTLQGGRPTASERTLDPFTPQQCAQSPDPARTPDTLCGTVCLEPGDYTLSLTAVHRRQQSAPSNLLDVDLTSSTSCVPGGSAAPVSASPPAPPRPTSSAGSAGGGLAVGGAAAALLAAQQQIPGLFGLPNLGCVQWLPVEPCVCPPFLPCTRVTYMEPAYIVEVVPKPGETVVPLLGGLLREALATVGSPALGGGGAANTSGPTNLHYNEVHVYDFPNIFGGPCTGCLPGGGLALHYASELDAVSWRTAAITPTPVDLLQQIGVWGPLYPRGGKVIHGSGVIAGALAAVRGMDIAHQPIGSPPHVDAHVVPLPALGRAGCLQLAYPKQLPCMDPGGPPPLWETGTTSLNGRYLYIVWQRRTCCVQVPTCGITLPGIGGYGQNLCALSLVP